MQHSMYLVEYNWNSVLNEHQTWKDNTEYIHTSDDVPNGPSIANLKKKKKKKKKKDTKQIIISILIKPYSMDILYQQ